MDERIKAHMALVKELCSLSSYHGYGSAVVWHNMAAVEASARQLAEQPEGMKLVPASPTLEVRKHLEGKVGVDFLIAYADWCRPLTASPTEPDERAEFEAWFEGQAFEYGSEHSDWFRKNGDLYVISHVQWTWDGWQERAARALKGTP